MIRFAVKFNTKDTEFLTKQFNQPRSSSIGIFKDARYANKYNVPVALVARTLNEGKYPVFRNNYDRNKSKWESYIASLLKEAFDKKQPTDLVSKLSILIQNDLKNEIKITNSPPISEATRKRRIAKGLGLQPIKETFTFYKNITYQVKKNT